MKPSTNKQFLRDCYGRRSLDTHRCQSTKYLLKLCYTPKTCSFPLSWKCLYPLSQVDTFFQTENYEQDKLMVSVRDDEDKKDF